MHNWRSEIQSTLAPLHLDPAREASIVAELEQHLEQQFTELVAHGTPESEARNTVSSGLDHHALIRELRPIPKQMTQRSPAMSAGNFWGSLLFDLRFGLRRLRKNPGFAAIAILTLAVGFGANSAVFSLVNRLLLRPLYPEIQRLLVLEDVPASIRGKELNMGYKMSYPIYLAWKEQKDIFDSVAALAMQGPSLTGMGEPERLRAAFVSSDYLPTLGIEPFLGRAFQPEDEPYSSPGVVLLSYSFWRSHFDSDRRVVGNKLTLNDKPFTVIGVLPESALSSLSGTAYDIVEPLREEPDSAVIGFNHLIVVGKLRSGLSQAAGIQAIQSRVNTVNQKFGRQEQDIQIIPLDFFLTSESRPLLLILLGGVGVVLLITCVNTANLLLARGATREKEMAIRMAVGAAHKRLVRQLVTESLLISVSGAALGLFVMWATETLVTKTLANRLPPGIAVHLDASVVLLTLGLALATGTIFGVLPGLLGQSKALREKLGQGGRVSIASGSHKLRNTLVVTEIGLSLVLLAAAGLLLRSFVRLMNVEKGFDPDHVLTLRIWPSPTRYADPQKYIAYLDQIYQRSEALPGTKAAGWVSCLPVSGTCTTGDFQIEGRPDNAESMIMGAKQLVAGDYFRAIHARLLRGRLFNENDKTGSAPVAIIDEAFARENFGEEDPLGKHIDFGWGGSQWAEIVGVVGGVKDSLATAATPTVYVPLAQKPKIIGHLAFSFALRTSYDPSASAGAMRQVIHQIDSGQIIEAVHTMDDVVDASVADRRAPLWLFGGFAAIALFLAVIGIYGVLSFYVTQRREEIGTRMALGAQRNDILWLVLGHAGKLIAAGLAAGVLVTIGVMRAISTLLYGTKPYDAATNLAVVMLLAFIAFLACGLPAFRATQVDPQVVLRNE